MPKTKPVYTRLNDNTREFIEREGTKGDRSLSYMISRICDEWVAKRKTRPKRKKGGEASV